MEHFSSASNLCALVVAVLVLFPYSASSSALTTNSSCNDENAQFVKNSCGATAYPNVCIKSLSSYSSEINTSYQKLANAALTVSLKSAKSASALVLKLLRRGQLKANEAAAVKDCVENIGESIDEVRQSLGELKSFNGNVGDLDFKMSNVRTWLSAALTDDDTCMEGLDEENVAPKVKNKIRSSIAGVAQLTSNALALVSNLNYTSSVN
ncbi:hypothetical protein Sjap_020478 [Stephania japonica]|uniref:Pectinesterase inhibitor domain-containing protein n=1 Tax=Stephania japonica TaxID=461633 RepID=A0AAP0F9Q0_9MAGN